MIPVMLESGARVIAPDSEFSFARLVDLISHGNATRQELERMQRMEGLAFHWKACAQDRLAR
jgi:hypothetical protein